MVNPVHEMIAMSVYSDFRLYDVDFQPATFIP